MRVAVRVLHSCAFINSGNVVEREGHDRMDINLSGSQLQLLQDVTNLVSSEFIM